MFLIMLITSTRWRWPLPQVPKEPTTFSSISIHRRNRTTTAIHPLITYSRLRARTRITSTRPHTPRTRITTQRP